MEDLQMKHLVCGYHILPTYSVSLYEVENWLSPPKSSFITITHTIEINAFTQCSHYPYYQNEMHPSNVKIEKIGIQ